jgi:hypothetical protein
LDLPLFFLDELVAVSVPQSGILVATEQENLGRRDGR